MKSKGDIKKELSQVRKERRKILRRKEISSEEWEEIDILTGWIDGLKWVIK
jgi:hypothetical protein